MKFLNVLMFCFCFAGNCIAQISDSYQNISVIQYIQINDSVFLNRVEDVIKIISVAEPQKGYLYVHTPQVEFADTLSFGIGWRNDPPEELLITEKEGVYFTLLNGIGVFLEKGVMPFLDHLLIGRIDLSDSLLDKLIYPDQLLIATKENGDTILFKQHWRPFSLYLHPQYEVRIRKRVF